ncbi:hypothetical protein RB595_002093 [Gaeumannomyces hyphopodioides]
MAKALHDSDPGNNMEAILLGLRARAPLLAVAALLLCAAWLAPRIRRRRSLAKLPLYGAELGSYPQREAAFRKRGIEIYSDSYRKFKGIVYRLTTSDGEKIIIPRAFLPELRNLPDHEIDNIRPLERGFESRYTGIIRRNHSEFLPQVIRADLTRNLARINPALCLEVERTIVEVFPPTDNWTCHKIESKLADMIAIVSGHIFMGPERCRDPEYLYPAVHYTKHVIRAVRALKLWPRWLRPLASLFIPELRQAEVHSARFKRFLTPIVRDRRERMARGEAGPDDMLHWMLARAESQGISDDDMASFQLGLSLAAIHTTTRAVTHVLFDLAAHPSVISALREEIRTATSENGVMTTKALFQMKLLDSVLKESHRVNPTGTGRFSRRVLKRLVLSDGTEIPADTTIEVAHGSMAMDPAIFPNPEKFDAYRFYRLRAGDGAEPNVAREQHQFVSVTSTDMCFGYGRHACPGRFFAANEIKLILARLLLDYDISMPEGLTGRHENRTIGAFQIPKPDAELRFRKTRDVC